MNVKRARLSHNRPHDWIGFSAMQRLLMTAVFEGNKFQQCQHKPNEKCDAHARATSVFYNLVQFYSLLKL
jgi:hypothetical protein